MAARAGRGGEGGGGLAQKKDLIHFEFKKCEKNKNS
jgi:hypothetical protein